MKRRVRTWDVCCPLCKGVVRTVEFPETESVFPVIQANPPVYHAEVESCVAALVQRLDALEVTVGCLERRHD